VSPAIIFRTHEQIERAVARIKAIKPDQENPLALWIGPYRKIRSLEQNALYFALLRRISEATGHNKETLHVYFKRKVFGVRVEEIGGDVLEVTPSSAKASRGDFSELLETVQAFISEHGIEEAA
jgi:hypothetical protein